MKILVPIKRVIDYNVQIQVKPDGSGVEMDNVKMSTNPFDEIAIEAALQLRETTQVSEITIVTIGLAQSVDILRQGLAMGADKAVLLKTDDMASLEPLMVAKILHKYAQEYSPDLIVMGKQAIDDDCNQTGQMLAELLQWPQATFASAIKLDHDNFEVTREIDGGLETISVSKPCVITTDLRLNTPRYVALPNILKAKQKPLDTLLLEDYCPGLSAKLKITHVAAPEVRKQGVIFDDIDTFIDKIAKDGVL